MVAETCLLQAWRAYQLKSKQRSRGSTGLTALICQTWSSLRCDPPRAVVANHVDLFGGFLASTCLSMCVAASNAVNTNAIVAATLLTVSCVQLLYAVLRFNVLSINFWLVNCVFPTDTRQFQANLKAHAWHLAERSTTSRVRSHVHRFLWLGVLSWSPVLFQSATAVQVCGFSGTNDNHWLLPFSVKATAAPETQATDGKNVLTFLEPGKVVVTTLALQNDAAAGPRADVLSQGAPEMHATDSVARQVLDLAVENGVNAIIDAGVLAASPALRLRMCCWLLADGSRNLMSPARFSVSQRTSCRGYACWPNTESSS